MHQKSPILSYLAIVSMFTLSAGGTYENPVVQMMIEAWPQLSPATIRLVITLPPLVSMITMLFVGRIVGRFIGYRPLCHLGSLSILIGGILPFFWHDQWAFILICRAILGFGIGLYSLRNPMLMHTVPSEKLSFYIGLGGITSSIVSVIISPVVGFLSQYGWNWAFLSNLLVLIPGIWMLLFLKEPPHPVQNENQETKAKLPGSVYLLFGIQFLATLSLYPLLSGISTYLSELNMGDATLAGWMLSIYTAGGIVANACLSRLEKRLGFRLLTMALCGPVIGCLAVIYAVHPIMLMAGIFISGLGFAIIFSLLQLLLSQRCEPVSLARASLWMLACNQLGVFLSSYFIDFSSNLTFYEMGMQNTYLMTIVIYLVLVAVSLKLSNRKKA